MATYQTQSYNLSNTIVIVRESDKYSQLAYLKFVRPGTADDAIHSSDVFLTADELSKFGKFLITQAVLIQNMQDARHSESSL